jgi:hypothetical protein
MCDLQARDTHARADDLKPHAPKVSPARFDIPLTGWDTTSRIVELRARAPEGQGADTPVSTCVQDSVFNNQTPPKFGPPFLDVPI